MTLTVVADRRLGPLVPKRRAADDIAIALSVPGEIAETILYGLIATNTVQACDDQQNLIDGDECTLSNLEGKPTWVDANELREWLRANVRGPIHGQREREIAKRLPRAVPWDEFCDGVRDACNGWYDKKKRKPAPGFSARQIKRKAKGLIGQ